MKRTVRLREELLHRIGVREWGLPTLVMPGKISRSRERRTITCALPKGIGKVQWDTRSVEIVGHPEEEWFPTTWRDAIWTYCRTYPYSAGDLVPFLRVSMEHRQALVRKLIAQAAHHDHISIMSSARTIGAFGSEWPVVGKW